MNLIQLMANILHSEPVSYCQKSLVSDSADLLSGLTFGEIFIN